MDYLCIFCCSCTLTNVYCVTHCCNNNFRTFSAYYSKPYILHTATIILSERCNSSPDKDAVILKYYTYFISKQSIHYLHERRGFDAKFPGSIPDKTKLVMVWLFWIVPPNLSLLWYSIGNFLVANQ